MKKKIFRTLLIIIFLILIIFLSMFIREIYIIEKLKNKAIELREITNYSYYEEKEFDTLDEKTLTVKRYNNTIISETETMKDIQIDNLSYTVFKKYGFYYDPYPLEESVSNSSNGYLTEFFAGFSNDEKSYDLALYLKIKTTTFEDIKCYAISYKQPDNNIYTIYINKETLLIEGKSLTNSEENTTYTNKIDIELNNQKAEDFVLENHLKEYEKYVPGSTNY